jgi:hypothetical protein
MNAASIPDPFAAPGLRVHGAGAGDRAFVDRLFQQCAAAFGGLATF